LDVFVCMSEENGLLKHKNLLHKNICAGKFRHDSGGNFGGT